MKFWIHFLPWKLTWQHCLILSKKTLDSLPLQVLEGHFLLVQTMVPIDTIDIVLAHVKTPASRRGLAFNSTHTTKEVEVEIALGCMDKF